MLSICCFFGCAKEEVSPVPYVIVDVIVPIYGHPRLSQGYSEKITNPPCGYANHGIIVTPYGSDYYAYDATCPKDITHAVNVNDDGTMTAYCPKCKITYNVRKDDGYSTDGSLRLKQYRAYSSSDNIRLFITN